jgi:predicted transcriptional regulator
MEVHFSPDNEAQLSRLAAEQGRNPDMLVQKIVDDYLAETARFIEAVKIGEADFEKGDYLTQAEVEAHMTRLVRG